METASESETPLKILLVEDNPGDVYIIKDSLKTTGTNFIVAHSSMLGDAIRLSAEQAFDVILLDLGLPDSIGLETLKKILATKVNAPVIVMTGLDDEETALTAMKEGAQDYLVKNNLTPGNILRAIRYGIERNKIQEIQVRHTRQFLILSTATVAINECEDVASIYDTICKNINQLLTNIIVFPVDLINQNTQVKELTNDKVIPAIKDSLKKVLNFHTDGKLHEVSNGILNLLGSETESGIFVEFEKKIRDYKAYAIDFSRDEKLYGGVFIFSKNRIELNDMDIIEIICSQASLNIHRRNVENDLIISEKSYRTLFKEVTIAKEELQKLNEELDSKIQIRTQELAEINNLLRLENATKDKFFGIIAHDLKNPFCGLLGASELLINYIDEYDIDNIKKIGILINESAKRGSALLENLLEWSRSQTGNIKFIPQRLNLRELVEENVLNMQPFVIQKKIELKSKIFEDIEVSADKEMLNTVLRNLISNSIKFTRTKGKISVSAEHWEDGVTINVKDTGIGIPKNDIDKLFKIDVQYTNAGTAMEKGTGLGLLLCKEFVEKHGGRIWVESEEGKGSEFKFTIPA